MPGISLPNPLASFFFVVLFFVVRVALRQMKRFLRKGGPETRSAYVSLQYGTGLVSFLSTARKGSFDSMLINLNDNHAYISVNIYIASYIKYILVLSISPQNVEKCPDLKM